MADRRPAAAGVERQGPQIDRPGGLVSTILNVAVTGANGARCSTTSPSGRPSTTPSSRCVATTLDSYSRSPIASLCFFQIYMEQQSQRRFGGLKLVMVCLFFASGLTSLGYEVLWFRRFSSVWGSSSIAMATVVASFLSGLGLGAWVAGRRIRQPAGCIAIYGLLELGIAAAALLIPFQLEFLRSHVFAILPAELESTVAWFAIRFSLTFVVLGPPCVMMGATLPVLVTALSSDQDESDQTVADLYAVNTAGAAAGCLLTGFYLLPAFGLVVTNYAFVAVNTAVGIFALLAARRLTSWVFGAQRTTPNQNLSGRGEPSFPAICAASALAGFSSLALQMTWSRQLALVSGSSTYGFTSTVFVVLFGIAIGSWLFRSFEYFRQASVHALAAVVIVLNIGVVIGTSLLPALSESVGLAQSMRGWQFLNALVCISAAMAIQLIPGIAMGIVFPMLVGLCGQLQDSIGRNVGTIYATNTLGAVCGALITSEFLFPALGTLQTLRLCIVLYFAVAGVLLPLHSLRQKKFAAAMAAMALVVPAAIQNQGPQLTNSGMFMYGKQSRSDEVLFFNEGRSCNVLVAETADSNNIFLRVNGKVDASTRGDMSMQLGTAYFPLFVNPEADNVFVVGFGSGTTAGAALQFPQTHVICCEIEPSVVDAAEHFTAVNHDPLSSNRFSVVYDDARGYLQRSDTKYDLILSEPSNPWIAGIAGLFTAEFYETARQRLNEKGILAQWVQSYSLSEKEYALVLRTITSVFPHAMLIRVSPGDTVILASDSPFSDLAQKTSESQQVVNNTSAIRDDLNQYFGSADVKTLLLNHWIHDESSIRKFLHTVDDTTINTDLNMRLEFDAPLRLFQSDATVQKELSRTVTARWYAQTFQRLKCGADQLPALKSIITQGVDSALTEGTDPSSYLELVELGALIDPKDPFFVTSRTLLGSKRSIEKSWQRLTAIGESEPERLSQLGVNYSRANRFDEAEKVFRLLTELHPHSSTAWAWLAQTLASTGNFAAAQAALEMTKKIDPINGMVETVENMLPKAVPN